MQNDKYGFVDGNGHLVIECIYDEVFEENLLADNPNDRYFVEGIARVKLNNKWGFINSDGKVIGEIKYKKVNRFGPDYAFVQDDKWRVMDRHGRIYNHFDFEDIRELSENIAVVTTKSIHGQLKCKYIHPDGSLLCDVSFDRADDFSNGYGVGWIGSKAFYIDGEGHVKKEKSIELYSF